MADIGNGKVTDSSKVPSEVTDTQAKPLRESLTPALAFTIVFVFALIIAAGLILILS
jgi:hypothetical protein